MAKDDECLSAIAAASDGKLADPEKLLADLKAARDINIKEKGMSPLAALAQGAEDVVSRYQQAVEEAKFKRFRDLEKRMTRRNGVTANVAQLMADNPKMPGEDAIAAALSALNVPTHRRIAGSYDTYEANLKLMHKVWVESPRNDLKQAGLLAYAYDPANALSIRQEMAALNSKDGKYKPGVSGDPHAQKVAEIWQSVGAAMIKAFRQEGIFIKSLPEYTGRMTYDPEKVEQDSPKDFQEFVEKHFDETRTMAGRDTDNPQHFFKDIYDNLVRGYHLVAGHEEGFTEPQFRHAAGKAGALVQRRVLHWQGPEAEQAVLERYGHYKDFSSQWEAALSRSAKSYAAIRQWGSNPAYEHAADVKYQIESQDPATVRRFIDAGYEDKLKDMFQLLDGTAERPTFRTWANITRGLQSIAVLKYGGKIPVVHYFGAPVTGMVTYPYIGSNRFTGVVNGLSAMLKVLNPTSRKQVAELAASLTEGIQGHLFSDFSFTDAGAKAGTFGQRMARDWNPSWDFGKMWKDTDFSGLLSTLAGGFLKGVGLERIFSLNRVFWEVPVSKILADHVKLPFEQLDPLHRDTLEGFNIKAGDWGIMQKIEPVLNSNALEHFTPNLAYKAPDDAIEALLRTQGGLTEKSSKAYVGQAVERYKDDLARKLWLYLQEGSRMALGQPGAKVANLLRGPEHAKNVPDAAWRSMRQLAMFFKQWPTELIYNTYARDWYRNPTLGSATSRVLATAAGLTVSGYMTLVTTALLQNKTPPSPEKAETWLKAVIRGGAGTVLSDLTGAELLRQGSFKERVGAAVTGVGGSSVEPLVNLFAHGLQGKNVDHDMQKVVKDNAMYTNAWYAQLGLNYLFLWHLYDTIDPGWAVRDEQNARKYDSPYLNDEIRPTQAVGQ